jgi:hypothetical protein
MNTLPKHEYPSQTPISVIQFLWIYTTVSSSGCEVVKKALEQSVRGNNSKISEGAHSATQEIQNILGSTHSPQDLAQMFLNIVVAGKIHRYIATPPDEIAEIATKSTVEKVKNNRRQ